MDLRGADLPLLVSLRALVSTRSVTRAARQLGISQPAMSAQLARLRDIFNDRLLVGNARGMVPTRRAEELAEGLQGPLSELARLMRAGPGFDPMHSDMTIQIAGSEHTNTVIGVPLMLRLKTVAPHMRLALHAFQPHRGAAQFAEHDIDLGLLTPSMVTDGMSSQQLFDDDLVLIRARGHRDTFGETSLQSYCRENHILVSTLGGGFSATVDVALAKRGLKRRVAASVQSFSVALRMVASSNMVTTLPRHYAKQWRDVVEVESLPLDVPKFAFHMVWPQRVALDPMHIWLREMVQEIAAEAVQPG